MKSFYVLEQVEPTLRPQRVRRRSYCSCPGYMLFAHKKFQSELAHLDLRHGEQNPVVHQNAASARLSSSRRCHDSIIASITHTEELIVAAWLHIVSSCDHLTSDERDGKKGWMDPSTWRGWQGSSPEGKSGSKRYLNRTRATIFTLGNSDGVALARVETLKKLISTALLNNIESEINPCCSMTARRDN